MKFVKITGTTLVVALVTSPSIAQSVAEPINRAYCGTILDAGDCNGHEKHFEKFADVGSGDTRTTTVVPQGSDRGYTVKRGAS